MNREREHGNIKHLHAFVDLGQIKIEKAFLNRTYLTHLSKTRSNRTISFGPVGNKIIDDRTRHNSTENQPVPISATHDKGRRTHHLHPLNFEMSKNMPQLTTIVECLLTD